MGGGRLISHNFWLVESSFHSLPLRSDFQEESFRMTPQLQEILRWNAPLRSIALRSGGMGPALRLIPVEDLGPPKTA